MGAGDRKTLTKSTVLERCHTKKDQQSENVIFRLATVNDLAAAECRYHKDCYAKFFSNDASDPSYVKPIECDRPFHDLLNIIDKDVSKIWTSSSFYSEYTKLCKDHKTSTCTKKWLLQKIRNHYGGETLITLSSTGNENIYVFKSFA